MNLYIFTILSKARFKGKGTTQYILLKVHMGTDVYEAYEENINEHKEFAEKEEGFESWVDEPRIFNKRKYSIKDLLDEMNTKLPELVKNAITREKLDKLKEVLED